MKTSRKENLLFFILELFLLQFLNVAVSDVISNLVVLSKFTSGPRGIAIDSVNQKLYWTLHIGQQIQRSNLDGTNVETVVQLDNYPFTIVVDAERDYIYFSLPWDRFHNSKIQRVHLDGTGLEDFVVLPPFSFPETIALDTRNLYLYWTDPAIVPQNKNPKIQKAPLNGTGPITTVVSNIPSPRGLAVDPYLQRVYWVTSAPDVPAIHYVGFDGSFPGSLLSGQIETPRGLATSVGNLNGYIYWSDIDKGTIGQVNVNGQASTIASNLYDPYAIALNSNTNEIYYVDTGAIPPVIGKTSIPQTNAGNHLKPLIPLFLLSMFIILH